MDNSGARIYKGKGSRGYFSSSDWLLHYNVSIVFLGMLLIGMLQQSWYLVKSSFLMLNPI